MKHDVNKPYGGGVITAVLSTAFASAAGVALVKFLNTSSSMQIKDAAKLKDARTSAGKYQEVSN